MSDQKCGEALHNEASAFLSNPLKLIFQKFYLWRPAPSDKAWALEKMTDVFVKELNDNPNLFNKDDFVAFTHEFFDDDGNILQYPEFVMNEITKMTTAVILNSADIKDRELVAMYKLLRSVVLCGQLGKGKRASTMFECMQRLLIKATAIDQMMSYEFDAAFALLFAVAGTQNYTRKSGSMYFIELVKFAYNESETTISSANALTNEARSSLRDTLSSLFIRFNTSLMESCKTSTSSCCLDIMANYCRVLTLCAENSSEWGLALAFKGKACECIYNIWCALLKQLSRHSHPDIGDVIVSSIGQLAVLANQRKHTGDGESTFEMLASLLLTDVADPGSIVNVGDMVVMAHSIVSRCESSLLLPYNRDALLDLSILPLLVVLDVQCSDLPSEVSGLINRTKEELEKEPVTKHSPLIIRALSNAFSLVDNREFMDSSKFSSVLNYVTLKTVEAPPIVLQPLLHQGMVPNKRALSFLIHGFKHFNIVLGDSTCKLKVSEVDAIQTYIAPVIDFPGISCADLITTLGCYINFLSHTEDVTRLAKMECLHSVLMSLELHLVNIDPNMREAAVTGLGRLCLLDIASVQKEVSASKTLPSLWKCVKDKEEDVVAQVFGLISQIVERGKGERLKEVLSQMQTTKEELLTELQKCLLSSQWDIIKPMAFTLYTSLSDPSDVIRYAEVCIRQSSSLATPAIFNFVAKLVTRWTNSEDDDIKAKIDGLCHLLLEGWGDLVLYVINGENTTCLRFAVDILVAVNEFMMRPDIAGFVQEKMTGDLEQADGDGVLADRLVMLKNKMMQFSMQILKGSPFLELCGGDNSINESTANGDKESTQGKQTIDMEVGEENDNKAYAEEVDAMEHLDSTAERQPLVLSDKPFLFPELVGNVVESSADKSKSSVNLFTWVSFRELLDQLPLTILLKEACKSTDEYERNSMTIFQDINDLMDASVKAHSKKIEREVVEVFLTKLVEIMKNALENEDSSRINEFKNSMTEINSRIEQFSLTKEPFVKFVLSKRKTALLNEQNWEKFEFSGDFFNNGLRIILDHVKKGISMKEFFSSSEGMKELLCIYFPCGTDKGSMSAAHKDSKLGECLQLPKQDFPGSCGAESETFDSTEDFQKAVEDIMGSKKSGVMLMIFDLVKRVTRLNTLEAGPSVIPTLKLVWKSLDQLTEWYCDKDDDGFDSDGDNDPALIDCY